MYFRKLCVAAALLLLGTWTNGAAADWQYTKWNMTPDEVVRASKGVAQPSTPADADKKYQNTVVKLKAPYKSGEFDFIAYFHFDESGKRLIAVALQLQNVDQATYLRGQLVSKYGNPDEAQTVANILQIDVWHEADRIVLSTSSDSATIKYEPRVGADNQGL